MPRENEYSSYNFSDQTEFGNAVFSDANRQNVTQYLLLSYMWLLCP